VTRDALAGSRLSRTPSRDRRREARARRAATRRHSPSLRFAVAVAVAVFGGAFADRGVEAEAPIDPPKLIECRADLKEFDQLRSILGDPAGLAGVG
jgi:hypothetical protein